MDYKISIDQISGIDIKISGILYHKILLLILEPILSVSWIVTKCTYFGITLEDIIAMHEKNNLQHLSLPIRN